MLKPSCPSLTVNPSAREEEPLCNSSASTECIFLSDFKVSICASHGPWGTLESLEYCFFVSILKVTTSCSQPEKMAEYAKDIVKALK